ncbi:MAG: right-handed parallel beta-helix repeat-containing protein [Chitinispirillaceae bacterium]|nr:right-handed parallel beta-helix repeat-containing protein [Chitinispirillaceae bacterium]
MRKTDALLDFYARISRQIVPVFVIIVLTISVVKSKTYYVATTGNNSASGTQSQPFATFQKGIDAAGPGDTVYVRGGVYKIVQLASGSAGVLFNKSGTSNEKRICYFAYPGETPVFDFAGLRILSDPNYTQGFVVNGAWLHLKGFEVCNVPMNTRSNTGISVGGNAHDDIFELLNIHHNFGSGFFIHTTTGGHQIINCDSHDNYDPYSHQGNGENADGFGVHYQTTGKSTVFRGCRAWWNSDDGYDFISQEVPVIVENCYAMGGGYVKSGTGTAGNGNGFKIGSSKTGIRHIVTNCVAWKNRASGFYANHSAGGNTWYNNTSYSNGTQYNMLASSWDANGNRTDGVTLTGSKVHIMRNNIGFPNKNSYMNGVDTKSNTWDLSITPATGDFKSLTDPSMTVTGQNLDVLSGMLGPRQADGSLPNVDFLKLAAGSRMIDKGLDVGLPYAAVAPDLGAYEFGFITEVNGIWTNRAIRNAVSAASEKRAVFSGYRSRSCFANKSTNARTGLGVYSISGRRYPVVSTSLPSAGMYITK